MAFLNDGFSTTIIVSGTTIPTTFRVKEKTVTPPGVAGGGPIDITTMRNTTVRTRAPKSLFQLDALELTVAYDPLVYSTIQTLIQQNRTISVNFPDGSALSFLGFIDEFKPQENREGEQPLANLTIWPTLDTDPGQLAGVETVPALLS